MREVNNTGYMLNYPWNKIILISFCIFSPNHGWQQVLTMGLALLDTLWFPEPLPRCAPWPASYEDVAWDQSLYHSIISQSVSLDRWQQKEISQAKQIISEQQQEAGTAEYELCGNGTPFSLRTQAKWIIERKTLHFFRPWQLPRCHL